MFNKKMLHEHRTYTHAVCVRQIEMREIKKKNLVQSTVRENEVCYIDQLNNRCAMFVHSCECEGKIYCM